MKKSTMLLLPLLGVLLSGVHVRASDAPLTAESQAPASQDLPVLERLDQSQTGRVTTFHLPSSGVWQSFTAGITGNLSRIDILLGQARPGDSCTTYVGDLALYRGSGRYEAPFFDPSNQVASQRIEGTECRCTSKDCVVWQKFVLERPLPVEKDEVYAFFLSPPHRSRRGAAFRVGLAVADLYTAGSNHFAAPGYDFTFKTYVKAKSQDGVNLNEQSTGATSVPVSSTAAVSDGASGGSTSLQLPLLVAGMVGAAMLLIVLVAAFVHRQRRRGTRVLALGAGVDSYTTHDDHGRKSDADDADAEVGFDDLSHGDMTPHESVSWRETFEAALDSQPVRRAWDASAHHPAIVTQGADDGGPWHGVPSSSAPTTTQASARAAAVQPDHTVLWLDFDEPSMDRETSPRDCSST